MSDTTETETGTNTDTTDEPSKAELHDRVQQLESTVEKLMPSRRDALRMGAAGLVGAAGLSATSQSVDASTGSAGEIGDPSNRPDLFADTVDANQLTGTDDINTRRVGDIVFAEGFTGGDPESRLDNALAAVGELDRLMLENTRYTQNRTISFKGVISGQAHGTRGPIVTGNWTFSAPTGLFHLSIHGDFTHDAGFAPVFDCNFGPGSLTVNTGDMVITHCNGVDVTLNSNNNVVAVNASGNNTITDNGGNNQIGLNA